MTLSILLCSCSQLPRSDVTCRRVDRTSGFSELTASPPRYRLTRWRRVPLEALVSSHLALFVRPYLDTFSSLIILCARVDLLLTRSRHGVVLLSSIACARRHGLTAAIAYAARNTQASISRLRQSIKRSNLFGGCVRVGQLHRTKKKEVVQRTLVAQLSLEIAAHGKARKVGQDRR